MESVESSLYSKIQSLRVELVLVSLSAIIVLIAVIMILSLPKDHTERPRLKIDAIQVDTKTPLDIYVDISGAVNNPGIYVVPSQSHISDIVTKAGGFATYADTEYVAKYINLAKVVENEEKIYIPSTSDPRPVDSAIEFININTASLEELASLPRIGKTTAQKIIEHRPYQSINQLIEQKILSTNLFNNIKSLIHIY